MRPPLLKKKEIDTLKAKEKAQAIAEGLKLTKRIDGLRELAAETEENYQKFTSAAVQTLQMEIDAKIKERDVLAEEIRILNNKRKELLIPLDFKWDAIHSLERELKIKESDLSKLEAEVAEKSVFLTVREREIYVSEGRAESLKRLSSAMFTQAESTLQKSKEDSIAMRDKAQAELSLVELKEVEVNKRENDISLKEVELAKERKKLEVYEIELTKREQTLRAGWKNLERTANKLKQYE